MQWSLEDIFLDERDEKFCMAGLCGDRITLMIGINPFYTGKGVYFFYRVGLVFDYVFVIGLFLEGLLVYSIKHGQLWKMRGSLLLFRYPPAKWLLYSD